MLRGKLHEGRHSVSLATVSWPLDWPTAGLQDTQLDEGADECLLNE